ncbi:MAG TPA: hypothetical protein VHQ41_03550 [Patescibacteria group bacterium]|jgi:CheY-like chemotaxis protein|nr:hypothetical protein [Patescibacteria group bacterium]
MRERNIEILLVDNNLRTIEQIVSELPGQVIAFGRPVFTIRKSGWEALNAIKDQGDIGKYYDLMIVGKGEDEEKAYAGINVISRARNTSSIAICTKTIYMAPRSHKQTEHGASAFLTRHGGKIKIGELVQTINALL